MRTCRLCLNLTELDDVALSLASGRCVCLRCYGRETGSTPVMPAALRRALRAVVAIAEQAPLDPGPPQQPHVTDAHPIAPTTSSDEAWRPRWWTEWWEPPADDS